MKRKYILLVLALVLAMFFVGCSGTGIITPSINLTGYWTAVAITTSSSDPSFWPIGGIATAEYSINDNNGTLTIYNFKIINQEFINWGVGQGTFNYPGLVITISGSYLNIYGYPINITINFQGSINASGLNGSGYFTENFSSLVGTDEVLGNVTFTKI